MKATFAQRVLRRSGIALYWGVVFALSIVLGVWLWQNVQVAAPDVLAFTWEDQEVKLLEPRALWLLMSAPLILGLQWFNLSDFHWFQRGLNIGLRILLLVALTFAMARPSVSDFDSHVCTTYLVDVSDSVPDAVLEQARDVVQRGYDARGTGMVRLVTFGARPVVVSIPQGAERVASLLRHDGEGAGLSSDPAAALRMSYGLCPPDHLKRTVIITDGNQNRGDLLGEAATAAEFGVTLYTHEIPFDPPAEVMVRNLEMPGDIEVGEPFVMTAEIFSNRETEVLLSLTQNEFRDIQGRRVALTPGMNRVELTAEVYEPGFRLFELTIRPDGADRFDANNRFTRSVTVEGRPRVLYVEGEFQSRMYLERALDRERNDLANFDLEVRGAYGFPTTLDELRNFDLVILSDVSAEFISRSAMANIETYVRELGGGLLMVGGENSFGPGGYDNTPLEAISPVTFDMQRQRDMPSLAMLLVIDRSGSMDGQKLEMAKDAARAVVDLMGPQDLIGVIAFDDAPQTVVRMQSASNRSRIRADIGRIGPGGGTNIYPALLEAWIQMIETRARIKHVIVLTDGQAPWDGIAEVVGDLRDENVTVSAVAVGREADRALLEMIAELGSGRFYQTNDPSNVPQIFVQETSQVARTNLVEEPFRPVVGRRSQALVGIAWDSVPYLLGFVKTQARPAAEVMLSTETGEPLLARWRQGLGRVAVFTSDIKNRWAVEWVRTRTYPQFWAQVVRDLMRVNSEDVLDMSAEVRQGVAHILVDAVGEDDRFVNGLTSTVTMVAPDGTEVTIPMRQTAAGRYEAQAALPQFGPYQLTADHQLDGNSFAASYGSVSYPYPDELLSVASNPDLARRAAILTGGSVDPEPSVLWDPGDELTEYRRELWPWALFAALGLFVIDLLLRRVRMFGLRPIRWSQVAG